MQRIGVRLLIRGRVQGVGYRWWAVREARRLRLDGWVRNRSDGSVELLAGGSPTAIGELEELCWDGPTSARVTAVERRDTDPPAERGFAERPSD